MSQGCASRQSDGLAHAQNPQRNRFTWQEEVWLCGQGAGHTKLQNLYAGMQSDNFDCFHYLGNSHGCSHAFNCHSGNVHNCFYLGNVQDRLQCSFRKSLF